MNRFFRSLTVMLVLIGLWQGLILLVHPAPYLFPAPWDVFKTLFTQSQLIGQQLLPTVIEIVAGLVLGVALGMGLALILCHSKTLYTFIFPLLLISQALPTFAIAPLLVVWLGYGLQAKIFTTMLMLFFPVANNFLTGLKETPIEYLDMAKLMNASEQQQLWQIRFPASLPKLAAGIRLATAFAPLGAIISEWVGSSQGLGFLLLSANAQMKIDLMFAVLFVLVCLSLTLYFLVNKLLLFFLTWPFEK